MSLNIQKNINLANYSTFRLGGSAENFVLVENSQQLQEVLIQNTNDIIWLLGYGSNCLISDKGLPGLTICIRGGNIEFDGLSAVVDAGVEWDQIVQQSIDNGFYGAEFMSKIPGSVGAALFINITAYGQSISSLVEWIEVFDKSTKKVTRLEKHQLNWGYKNSYFQSNEGKGLIILRASLKFSNQKTEDIVYQKALDVAEELRLSLDDLRDRRKIIIEARARAGSIYDSKGPKTVGSFFRNPLISSSQVSAIVANDESGKTEAQIKTMNKVHGGDEQRVSAAHVMLAAGFNRGQSWGNIKLNDKNLLKIEALPGATAQELYDVVTLIQNTVREKLGIDLEPEAKIMGDFS